MSSPTTNIKIPINATTQEGSESGRAVYLSDLENPQIVKVPYIATSLMREYAIYALEMWHGFPIPVHNTHALSEESGN